MKPRLKTHSFPGDVSKQKKEQMLERPRDSAEKTYKKIVRMKERSVLKRRAKKEIKRQTEDT